MKPCHEGFTPGYHWYGGRRRGPGRPPRWVETVLAGEGTPRQNTPSSDFLESNPDEPLLPSLFDDAPTDTQASESIPGPTEVPEDQEDTEGTKNCPDSDSDSDKNRVDVDEHIQECEDEIQPSRYILPDALRRDTEEGSGVTRLEILTIISYVTFALTQYDCNVCKHVPSS